MNKRVLLLVLVLAVTATSAVTVFFSAKRETCQSNPLFSCFNQRVIEPHQDWSHYSFVALGHIRTGRNKPGPNRNLQRNLYRVLAHDPAFVIALGDLYYSISDESIDNITRWVSANIPVPFFNAVGNHDTQTSAGHEPARYADTFGTPSFDFVLGSELYIFLENGSSPVLSEQQKTRLEALISQAGDDTAIRNIFLFSHQLFWSYYNPALEPVFRYRHPVTPPSNYRYFLDTIKPLVESLPVGKRVFFLAGDIGGGRRFLQTFYHREGPITYIATGMGNASRDSFLTVTIIGGEVSLKATNFRSGETISLEEFGLDYWRTFYRDNPEFATEIDRTNNAR